jgi:hypothetical protein
MVSTHIVAQLALINVADTSVEKHTHLYNIDGHGLNDRITFLLH